MGGIHEGERRPEPDAESDKRCLLSWDLEGPALSDMVDCGFGCTERTRSLEIRSRSQQDGRPPGFQGRQSSETPGAGVPIVSREQPRCWE